MTPFEVFLIDHPWQKNKGGLRKVRPKQDRSLGYQTMPADEIFKLLDQEIFRMACRNHAVFIWTIDQFLMDCEAAMAARGYKRHCRFIWDKMNGIAPAFTIRYTHEYLIWYYKVQFVPIATAVRGVFKTVFSEKARQHSRKPEYAYAMIEKLYPLQSKIDVFSRQQRGGWAQFGDQPNYFNPDK